MSTRLPIVLKALSVAAVLALLLTACGGSTTSPTTTTPPDKEDDFASPADTPLAAGGLAFHFFTAQPGEIDVNLVSSVGVVANAAVTIGLGSASTDATVCTPFSGASGIARAGTGFAITVAGSGSFCVFIQDSLDLGPIAYAIQVLHH